MASVKKRTRQRIVRDKDGNERTVTVEVWRARYRDDAGREHASHHARKVDAQRWLDEQTASLVTGQWADPKAGRETFRSYAERWRVVQDHRPGTAALYERVLRLRIFPALGDLPLGAMRHSHVQAFVTGLNRTCKPNTARQAHAIARTICRAAVSDRLITRTPFEGVTMPRVSIRSDQTPFTGAEVRALYEAADERIRAVILLAAFSGLRRGELLGLRTGDVDWLRATATVDPDQGQLIRLPGWVHLAPPKTLTSARTVPVPRFVTEALSAHLAAYPASTKDIEGLIFTNDEGGPALTSTLNVRWHRALAAAGLPKRNFHALRHTYASWLMAAGVPFTTVSELLGHAPKGVTWAVYLHRVEGWDTQVRNALETIWGDAGADSVRTDDAQ